MIVLTLAGRTLLAGHYDAYICTGKYNIDVPVSACAYRNAMMMDLKGYAKLDKMGFKRVQLHLSRCWRDRYFVYMYMYTQT